MDLYFKDFAVEMDSHFTANGWTKVSDHEMFCGLIDPVSTAGVMAHYGWDMLYQESVPVIEMANNPPYARFGTTQCEALAIYRDGYEGVDEYVELSEEFRLFHNLREDYQAPDRRLYFAINADGSHDEVVRIEGMRMLISTSYLRKYLATRQKNLLVFFDLLRSEECEFASLGVAPIHNQLERKADRITIFSLFEGYGKKATSRLEGKVLIEYDPNDFEDPFSRPTVQHQNFIYGVDNTGKPIEATCAKDQLPNRFNYNGVGPYVMTPIFFRKAVLDKYYGMPNLYSVEDGCVRCGDTWVFTTVDNDQRDYVVVPLGYLSELPASEQLYWKNFNVKPPYQGQLSNTAFTRWEKGEAINPSFPDLRFKIEFGIYNAQWQEKIGWPLFLPLTDPDQHRWKTLHCLTTANNDVDFDEQVLSLVKITVDSLNQEELKKGIDPTKQEVIACLKAKNKELKEITAGIDKFQLYCLSRGIACDDIVTFMRNLQSLRSFDVAHRKSSDPKKREKFLTYFDYYNKTQQMVLEGIFEQWLNHLQKLVEQI